MKRVKTFNRFLITIITLAVLCKTLQGAPPQKFTDTKYKNRQLGLPYMTVSAGAGVAYSSLQPGMSARYMPYSIMFEYGRTSYPVSIVAGTFVNTTFTRDRFILNSNNLLAGLQFAPLRGEPVSRRFNLYGIAGINLAYTRFTEELYPEIVNYEYKVEKSVGAGLAAGIGMGYRINSFEIKPMLFYFTGQAGFLAGHFTEQQFSTGSMQFHITLNYRMIFNRNGRSCPAFRKYYRL